jgi:hypothetical protein
VKKAPASAPLPALARAEDERAVAIPAWSRRLAKLLDSAITIPGTNIKIGLDPILGLILPELGDALTATLAVTLLGVAWKERVPKVVFGRMLVNIVIDALLGAVPVVGDLFDFAFRANDKNLALIERHRGDPRRKPTWGDRLVVSGAVVGALAALALPLVVGVLLLRWVLSHLG